MTCSLVVNSKSGNTRMVSGAIKRALQAAGVEFIHAAALSDDADAEQIAREAQGACAGSIRANWRAEKFPVGSERDKDDLAKRLAVVVFPHHFGP